MINFRYHVVSLTAVFLALAIGLVVGTAALNGPAADALNETVNALRKDNKQLREQVGHLEDEVNREEDFASEAAHYMIGGTLAGRRVLLVTTSRGQEYAEGVTRMLTLAGATVTGQVDVQDSFTHPENNLELLDLADQVLSPVLQAGDLPTNSDGVETSSALLATVLLDRTPAVAPGDLGSVLSAYTAAGYLSVPDEVAGPAEAVVVLAGLPFVDSDATAKNDAEVTMVVQFAAAGPVLVVGPGVAGDGNVISQLRADPTLAESISTVDNASTAQGQVVTALALGEQLNGGAGHYGTRSGATSQMPKQLQ